MLEQSTWLLEPWNFVAKANDGAAHIASIRDTAGNPLGFVRLDGDARTSWFSWLGRVRLDVFETDDASHLMTLRRTWGVLGSWDIEDAEQRHVGTIYSKTLATSTSERLGYIDRDGDRILDPAGKVCARLSRKEGAILELDLSQEVPANPFVRMMIFGAALTLVPLPSH